MTNLIDQDKIEEGNKKIAYFIGAVKEENSFSFQFKMPDGKYKFLLELEYFNSFDALQPVMDKIESMGFSFGMTRVNGDVYCNFYVTKHGRVCDAPALAGIDADRQKAVWLAVTNFIDWFNSKRQFLIENHLKIELANQDFIYLVDSRYYRPENYKNCNEWGKCEVFPFKMLTLIYEIKDVWVKHELANSRNEITDWMRRQKYFPTSFRDYSKHPAPYSVTKEESFLSLLKSTIDKHFSIPSIQLFERALSPIEKVVPDSQEIKVGDSLKQAGGHELYDYPVQMVILFCPKEKANGNSN